MADYEQIILEAISKVLAEHGYLTEVGNRDIHERSLTHRLAYHLETSGYFCGYHVDCEYNRYGNETRVNASNKPIYPDIIVHVRGVQTANLIIIQAKKFNDPLTEIENAKEDLKYVKRQLQYKHGYLVVFPEDSNSLDEGVIFEC